MTTTPLMIDVNKPHIRFAGGLQLGAPVGDAENGTIGFISGLLKVKEAGSWVNLHSYISGTVKGNLAIAAGGGGTGTLTCADTLTADGGAVITAGGLLVTGGGAEITDGGLAVTAGGLVVTAGGATVSAGNLDVTLGNITAAAGNIAATLGSLSAGTTVTAGTGITATTGNIKATTGGFHTGAAVAVAECVALPTGKGVYVNAKKVLTDQVTGYITAAGAGASLDASAGGLNINIATITATDGNIQALAKYVQGIAGALATHGIIGA